MRTRGEDRRLHAQEALGESNPANTLVLDVWPPDWEKVNFCCLSHPPCGPLLQQSEQTDTRTYYVRGGSCHEGSVVSKPDEVPVSGTHILLGGPPRQESRPMKKAAVMQPQVTTGCLEEREWVTDPGVSVRGGGRGCLRACLCI